MRLSGAMEVAYPFFFEQTGAVKTIPSAITAIHSKFTGF
jgi:hypothetical protein